MKPFWKSKTFAGLLITVIGVAKDACGWEWLDVAEADRAINLGLELAGIAISAYGRLKAQEGLFVRAPKIVPPILLAVVAVTAGCATAESAEKAGQGAVRNTASAWNSVATTEDSALLRDGAGAASEGTEIPVLDGEGKIVTDGLGQPVFMRIARGVRDINLFYGDVEITASTNTQGTSDATQAATQTPENKPGEGASVTIPLAPK